MQVESRELDAGGRSPFHPGFEEWNAEAARNRQRGGQISPEQVSHYRKF
jgi:hypothetical protein